MGLKLNINDVGQLLNNSTTQLDYGTLDKLHTARRTALQYQQTRQPAPVLSWLNEHGLIHHHHGHHSHKALNFGMAVLLVAVLIGGVSYWQHSYEHDHSDIDIAILTDDLPVDMYVD